MKTQVLEQEYLIEKRLEGKYLFVPFQCPKDVYRMEISYDYKRFDVVGDTKGEKKIEVNIIDLGLHDECDEFRGASGSNKKKIFIEENKSTPGYINGAIHSGTWRIMFGAYQVENAGCVVNFKVVFHFKKRVLLKGDLHLHSQVSDGDYTPRQVIRLASMMKLDYIFLTDHNNYHQNNFILPGEDLTVIPGMEVTLYKGHCNLLGVKKPVTSFFANSKEEFVEMLKEARSNGALISINHPHDDHCPWLWGYDLPYDVLEIQNSFYREHISRRTIDFWHERLLDGQRLPIVGGSDNHGIRFMEAPASPCTCLYVYGDGQQDILKAVKNGNGFVSCFTNGPEISLSIDGYIMGDVVPEVCTGEIIIEVRDLKLYDEIKVISDLGMVHEEVNQGQNIKKLIFEQIGAKFYRVEIWRYIAPEVKILGAISNPIYVGDSHWQE